MPTKLALLAASTLIAATSLLVTPTGASALSPNVTFTARASTTWQANGTAYAVAGAGGVAAVGGSFTQILPPAGSGGSAQNRPALALFDAATGSPSRCQFRLGASGGTPTVRAIAKAPTGNTLYIGGTFTSVNGIPRANLAAIDPVACTLSRTFRPGAIDGAVTSLYAPSNGTVYLGGGFTTVAGQTRAGVAAVDAASGAVTAFDAKLSVSEGSDPGVTVNGFALSPNGSSLVIGGAFDLVSGRDSHALAQVDPATGALRQDYPMYYAIHGLWFFDRPYTVNAITADADRFYIGGAGDGTAGSVGLRSFSWVDPYSWDPDGCTGTIRAFALTDDVLYSAGHRDDCSRVGLWQGNESQHLTAERASAYPNERQPFDGWYPDTNDGPNSGIGPRALAAVDASSGSHWLWSVGDFTTVNGRPQRAITRFGTSDTARPPTPFVTAQALLPGQVQVRFRTVVDPDDARLVYNVYRNGASTPTWTWGATSSFWTRPQVTFTDKDVTAGKTYSYRVTATDAAGNVSTLSAAVSARVSGTARPYAAAVIADGARLYWRYDEGSGPVVEDKSGANPGAGINGVYGGPGGITRRVGGAVKNDASTAVTLDGSKGYVWSDQRVWSSDDGGAVGSDISTETWFKTSTTRGGLLVGYGDARESTDTHVMPESWNVNDQLFMTDDGKVNLGAGARSVSSEASYNDGAWHHVVGSADGSGLTLYVDGQVVASRPDGGLGVDVMSGGTWHVGYDVVGVNTTTSNAYGDGVVRVEHHQLWPVLPSSNYFAGSIDETAVYLNPLTAAQVANHYALGK